MSKLDYNTQPLYNARLIQYRMQEQNITAAELSRKTGISRPVAIDLEKGRGGVKTFRIVKTASDFLGVSWEYMTTVDLPESEFHRAVIRSGTRSAVR